MIDQIYMMTPINKTAATVVGQSGCEDKLTDEQLRANIADRAGQLNKYLATCGLSKNHPDRKKVAIEYNDLCIQLKQIRENLGVKPKGRDISPFFLLQSKSELSKYQFDKIYKAAYELGNKYNWDTDAMKNELETKSPN